MTHEEAVAKGYYKNRRPPDWWKRCQEAILRTTTPEERREWSRQAAESRKQTMARRKAEREAGS